MPRLILLLHKGGQLLRHIEIPNKLALTLTEAPVEVLSNIFETHALEQPAENGTDPIGA